MSLHSLFEPLSLGSLTLPNRLFMAPLTRGRAHLDGTPLPLMAEYYRQRASAGLIVSEATAISPQGVGWVRAPGIFTDAHQDAWGEITAAVHTAGGRIFMQLWHMGRVSHPDFHGGELPVGASAIAAPGTSRSANGRKPYVAPRPLEAHELPGIAADYATAARRAVEAGFDGVEIHGANGYLVDQFIRDASNHRDDAYGGSVAARWRFPLEVVDAVVEAVGATRTAIRLSPTGFLNGMSDSDPMGSYGHGVEELSRRGMAYLHLVAPVSGSMAAPGAPDVVPALRAAFEGVLVLNGGYSAKDAQRALDAGRADAIAFGVPFLANPDLPVRLRAGARLNKADPQTFYTQGAEGYTDYPTLDD